MRGTALLVLLLSSLLAGCSSGPSEPTPEPTVITDPRTPSDPTGEHIHDYWGGAGELTVVDGTASSTWNNLGGGAWRRTFSPPDGTVVPQGTARITVTVDWEDDLPANHHADVSLWAKPANAAEPRFVQAIQKGAIVEVATAYEEADLPHQVLSGWEFTVQYNSSDDGYNLFFGRTRLTAVAHRGLELQPFPAHPDRWAGRFALEVVNATSPFFNVGYTGTGNLPLRFRPQNGSVVPADSARVDVELRTANELPAGGVQLYFHAADTRRFQALEPGSADGGVLRYSIPVAPGMGDGPYSEASLWEFQVYTPPAAPGEQPAMYRGPLHLTAVAHRGA